MPENTSREPSAHNENQPEEKSSSDITRYDYSDKYYLKEKNKQPYHDIPLSLNQFESTIRSLHTETNPQIAALMSKLSGVRDEDVFNPMYHLKRIANINPSLALMLVDAAEAGMEEFELALTSAVGNSQEIEHYYSLSLAQTLEKIQAQIGEFEITGRAHWRSSRDTHILRLRDSTGNNYRLWWWVHADNHSVGTEGVLFHEAPEITEHEMAFFE